MTHPEAPARLYAEMPEVIDHMGFWQEHPSADLVEYVRADLVAALVAAAKEVGRISDRDNVAWHRLSAALGEVA